MNLPEANRILVVDDEASLRFFLTEELESAGYEVYSAANGQEALTFLERTQVDLAIVDLQMREIAERLGDHEITLELTESARVWLAEQGFDPAFGARPLRRTLQKQVESPLSVQLLRGDFKSGDVIVVDYNDEHGLQFIGKEDLVVEMPAQSVQIE